MLAFGKKKVVVKTYASDHPWILNPVAGKNASDKFQKDGPRMAKQGYAMAIESQDWWTGELTVSYRLAAGH